MIAEKVERLRDSFTRMMSIIIFFFPKFVTSIVNGMLQDS